MHNLYSLKEQIIKELEEYGKRDTLTQSALMDVDTLAHAAKNLCKVIEACEEEEYSGRMSRYGGGRSYDGESNRSYYSRDGYYYDDGDMSNRRGRARNGRFVSRDASDMARQLREMMEKAPDSATKSDIQRLAEKMENM